MKNIFFTLLLFPSLLFAQKDFVINGNISGLPDGMVKIVNAQDTNQVISAAESKGGVFSLKGSVKEPTLYWITFGKNQAQYLFVDGGNIKISGSQNDIKNFKVEGSPSHKDFLDFEKIFNPMLGELNSIASQFQQAPQDKKQGLADQYYSVVRKISTETNKFITSKKSSYVSLWLLQLNRQFDQNPDIVTIERNFNYLDPKVRNTELGKDLANYIAFNKVGAVGTEAIDFTQNDVDGKPVKLSSFKGKYVLVDFWASWCRPCRAENPNVVKAYNKFKNKNFTILSVSLDQTKDAWVNAIAQDKLMWNHVSDLKQWNNAVAVTYHVQSIPTNFLVDPNGKIIAKELRGDELEKKLNEVLGK